MNTIYIRPLDVMELHYTTITPQLLLNGTGLRRVTTRDEKVCNGFLNLTVLHTYTVNEGLKKAPH